MEGYGLSASRWVHAVEGWLPLVAFASSMWLLYAASDLDRVSAPASRQAVPPCDAAAVGNSALDCRTAGRR